MAYFYLTLLFYQAQVNTMQLALAHQGPHIPLPRMREHVWKPQDYLVHLLSMELLLFAF